MKTLGLAFLLVAVCFACGGGGGNGGKDATTVSGRVLDTNDAAVADAEVTISSNPVVGSTGVDGRFSVLVESGEHEMVITKNDLVLYSADVTCYPGLPLNMGEIQTGLSVLLDELFDDIGTWELYEHREGEGGGEEGNDEATAEIKDGILYVYAGQECGYAKASALLRIEELPGLQDFSLEMLVNSLGGTGEGSIWLSIHFSGFHFSDALYDYFDDFENEQHLIKINHINGETCLYLDEIAVDDCLSPDPELDGEVDQATIEFSGIGNAPDCHESAWVEVDEIKIYATLVDGAILDELN